MKKKTSRVPKAAPRSSADVLTDRLINEAIDRGIPFLLDEGPKIVGKLWEMFFPPEGEKKQKVSSANEARDQDNIISADFAGLGDENWWEVLGLNINASESEIHEAAEKLLAKKQSTKSVSEKARKEIEKNRKRVLGAYVMGLAAVRAKKE